MSYNLINGIKPGQTRKGNVTMLNPKVIYRISEEIITNQSLGLSNNAKSETTITLTEDSYYIEKKFIDGTDYPVTVRVFMSDEGVCGHFAEPIQKELNRTMSELFGENYKSTVKFANSPEM